VTNSRIPATIDTLPVLQKLRETLRKVWCDMKLKDKRIAILVADLYEDLEFWYPYLRMQEEGAEVVSIGPTTDIVKGKHGLTVHPDKAIDQVKAIEFDAAIIPGGYSPDRMRRHPRMVEFVAEINKQDKPLAAICHGPWMLASAGVLKGRHVTSFFSIKDDLINAGAQWKDLKVVKSDNLITSRNPGDLPAFCTAIIEAVSAEEPHPQVGSRPALGATKP
jgi:protease I